MSTPSSCNGWSNYETWVTNLWINENEHSQQLLLSAQGLSTEAYEQADWLRERLSLQLDDEIDVPCLWQDLLRHAFGQVEWLEIVRAVD